MPATASQTNVSVIIHSTVLFFQANGIIKKLQGEIRELLGKIKVKNSVTVSQEKLLQDTSAQLQRVEKEFQSAQETLASKEEQVGVAVLLRLQMLLSV